MISHPNSGVTLFYIDMADEIYNSSIIMITIEKGGCPVKDVRYQTGPHQLSAPPYKRL